MKATLRNIIYSKTNWWHLMSRLISTASVTALLFILIIPLILWSTYGESAVGYRLMKSPLIVFIGDWMALIMIELFLCVQMWKNTYRYNLSKSKSYMIVIPIILILYLFRTPFAGFMFSILQ